MEFKNYGAFMIKNIFLDLDDTLLDFHKGEREAITKTLSHFGVEVTDELIARYRSFNRSCWEALERGEMKRDDVLTKRFELFFDSVGRDVSATEVQAYYEVRLSEGCYFIDGAEQLLSELSGKYNLYITSNGTAFVQDRRIKASGIAEYFDGIFISERMGAHKPSVDFFNACFSNMKNPVREQTVIIGDSLTSDILGGINAGIHTCHYTLGRDFEYTDIKPEYSVKYLSEIPGILEKI